MLKAAQFQTLLLTTGMKSSEKLFPAYVADDKVLTSSCYHVVKIANDHRDMPISMAATLSLAGGARPAPFGGGDDVCGDDDPTAAAQATHVGVHLRRLAGDEDRRSVALQHGRGRSQLHPRWLCRGHRVGVHPDVGCRSCRATAASSSPTRRAVALACRACHVLCTSSRRRCALLHMAEGGDQRRGGRGEGSARLERGERAERAHRVPCHLPHGR